MIAEKLIGLIQDDKKRHLAYTGLGMVTLLGGGKLSALSLFGTGLWGLEKKWRVDHPEFDGGLVERWEKAISFYESTHQEGTNRRLHIVGIPLIVGGAVGLLIFVPFGPRWVLSAASFTSGWALNFVGHGLFEKKAPAFADDPLSFLAGPVWDFQQLFKKKQAKDKTKGNKGKKGAERAHGGRGTPPDSEDAEFTVINVDPSEPAVA
jgi:hypothetical protein